MRYALRLWVLLLWPVVSVVSVVWLCALFCGTGLRADDTPPLLLQAVGPGPSYILSSGETVKLAGVWFPDTEIASRHLQVLTGRVVTLTRPARRDRYGAIRSDILLGEDQHLSTGLIRRGIALAFAGPFDLPPPGAWDAERLAEKDRLGLWSDPDFLLVGGAALSPDPIHYGSGMKILRVQVKTVGVREKWSYLNFGDDWSTDLTVKLSHDIHMALDADGLSPPSLAGRWIEVRGWLAEDGGPSMTLSHAAHLRAITAPPAPVPSSPISPYPVQPEPASPPARSPRPPKQSGLPAQQP